MTAFTTPGFNYILSVFGSHAGAKARGPFAFAAGAAKGTLRHNLCLECSADLAFSKKDPGPPVYDLMSRLR
jgi:hypothetical protein